jgi:hypothetical protein
MIGELPDRPRVIPGLSKLLGLRVRRRLDRSFPSDKLGCGSNQEHALAAVLYKHAMIEADLRMSGRPAKPRRDTRQSDLDFGL